MDGPTGPVHRKEGLVLTQKIPFGDRVRKLFSNVWTIPNVLTMLRLVLIPVFVVCFFKGHPAGAEPVDKWIKIALAVFVTASVTDALDGFLARKLNQITDFGKLFDPLADKLMVLTAMVCQGIVGVFPWTAIAIVALKEGFMVLGGMYMLSRNVVVYSNYVGKTAQVCFIISLVLSFFHRELTQWGPQIPGGGLDIILLWLTVALSLVAMVIYIVASVRKVKGSKEQDPA